MKITANQLKSSYDLIVVGSGPAGITVAREYAALSGKRVLIVESGPESGMENPAQDLAKATATGENAAWKYALHSQRLLGGTSNIWTGVCATLEKRSFIRGEWPISYAELERHYPQAAQILRLPPEIHTAPQEAPIGGGPVVYRPIYSTGYRFNAANRELMAWLQSQPLVEILFNHTATAALIEGSRCVGVALKETRNGGGRTLNVNSEFTVTACGGVHNARFLLLSLPRDHRLPVGRYFCMHPHIDGQVNVTLDYDAITDAMAGFSARRISTMTLSSEFLARNNLLSIFYAFSIYRKKVSTRSILAVNKATTVSVHQLRAEMPLLQENRVRLSTERKDFLGQPLVHVDLKNDRDSIEATHRETAAQLLKSGAGRMSVLGGKTPTFKRNAFHKVRVLGPDWRVGHYGGHLMCATRMGRSPDTAVVDENCQVYGVAGLYVAGSSVFSAATSANPTYTIVALSLRLAHHLAGVKS